MIKYIVMRLERIIQREGELIPKPVIAIITVCHWRIGRYGDRVCFRVELQNAQLSAFLPIVLIIIHHLCHDAIRLIKRS